MKRWAILVVALYAVMLALLTMPLLYAYGFQYSKHSKSWSNDFGLEELFALIQHWGYWLWLGVMIAGQALLLVVPVAARAGRPVGRRKLLVPVVTAAFLMGNVALAGLFSLGVLIFGDDAFNVLEWTADAGRAATAQVPFITKALGPVALAPGSGWFEMSVVAGFVVILWMIWGLIFLRLSRNDDEESLTGRLTRWLLRGSILELLVAVPSHVIVRQRDECCAPVATFWGITCGLTVMLLSFGPGVFFLFAGRMRRLKPAASVAPAPPSNPA